MYKSPISITERLLDEYAKMVIERRDNEILAKVQSVVDVDVEKAELLRALQYDRDQYEKGYADGKDDAAPEWISVKDRLPKPYTRALVRVNGYKDILVGWYTETFKDSNNEKFDCWCIEYKLSERSMEPVTHWMPLPQPPKGE